MDRNCTWKLQQSCRVLVNFDSLTRLVKWNVVSFSLNHAITSNKKKWNSRYCFIENEIFIESQLSIFPFKNKPTQQPIKSTGPKI